MRSIIFISIVMLSGCTNLPPTHDAATAIYKKNSKIKLASYQVDSVINYPELAQSHLYHEGKIGDTGSAFFVSECKGDEFNMAVHPVILYRQGDDYRLAYPYKYQCKINDINIKSYLQSKNDAVIEVRESKAAKQRELLSYRKTQQFAFEVFEQVGHDRAIAVSCMKNNLISGESFIMYDKKAIVYAKTLTGTNYDDNLMQSALTRSFQLVKDGKLRVSYDYCRGVDFGSPIYERFEVITD